MTERALEDFTEYELEDSKIRGYYVAILNQPFFWRAGKGICGSHTRSQKMIKLSRGTIQVNGTFKILETIEHEHTHAEQYVWIENEWYNRDVYKMLKESILETYYKSFRDNNYWHLHSEIDARIKGYMKRLKISRRIGLTDAEIAELQGDNVQKKVEEYCRDYKVAKLKKVGKETKDVNTIFLELLQKHPELLNEFPELRIEFEIQGGTVQRRSFANMLNSYEQVLGQAKNQRDIERVSSFFNEILIDDMARSIAEGNDEQALKYYEEYRIIYEKITGKRFSKSFEELKEIRDRK